MAQPSGVHGVSKDCAIPLYPAVEAWLPAPAFHRGELVEALRAESTALACVLFEHGALGCGHSSIFSVLLPPLTTSPPPPFA